MALTAGSICAGIGGLERLLPVDMRWHAEMDPHVSKVLERHWPGVPNLGDIKDVNWGTVEPVDMILGGPPCQPISSAGKRKGTEDERWLWPWVWGAVRALRPRYVFLENPGAIAGWLGDVLGGLAEIGGYEARWNCLRACDVGAPHGRLRWFLLAWDTDSARTDPHAPAGTSRHPARESSSGPAPYATTLGRRQAWEALTGARSSAGGQPGALGELGGCSSTTAYAGGGELQRRGERRDVAGSALKDQGAGDQRERDGNAFSDRRAAPTNTGNRLEPEELERHEELGRDGNQTLIASRARTGSRVAERSGTAGVRGRGPARTDDGAAPDAYGTGLEGRGGAGGSGDEQPARADGVAEQAWGAYEPAIRRWEALTRRAPTAVDGRGQLSPAFVEWMMGFPAGWTDGLKRNQALKCLGNAVVSQQALAAWDLLWAEARQGVR